MLDGIWACSERQSLPHKGCSLIDGQRMGERKDLDVTAENQKGEAMESMAEHLLGASKCPKHKTIPPLQS